MKSKAARGKRKEENGPVAKNFSAPPADQPGNPGEIALKSLVLTPVSDFNGGKVKFPGFIAGLAGVLWLPLAVKAVPENLFNPQLEEQEARFYAIQTVPVPTNIVLEPGGMAFAPDGALFVCTRRGEVWSMRDNRWKRFASGLDEPLGLLMVHSNELIVAQRSELTRLTDTNNDGAADCFDTISAAWNYTGHQYEFTFGPVRDREGNLFCALTCWFFPNKYYAEPPYIGWELEPPPGYQPNTRPQWRGWCFEITPKGEFVPWASGFRSPNGLLMTPDGDLLIMENQGEYIGSDQLNHVHKGDFVGQPTSMFWGPGMVDDPFAVPLEELDARRAPPILIFPYDLMGRSASEPVLDLTGGRFGPFAGDMFVGDVSQSRVMRATLQKVGGDYQGACYPFKRGFASGCNRAVFAPDGSLWIGETSRGWGSVGGRPQGLERLVWRGEIPFEIAKMELTQSGFELTFTKPVDVASASSPKAYLFRHDYYKYDRAYFAPIVGAGVDEITSVKVSGDGRKVAVELSGLIPERIYQVDLQGIKAADGSELLHSSAYYTLNHLVTNR
jgi:hypothetical protein